MNFLCPDFLFWLPLTLIPLLIYLFFKKKLKKIEFSSLFLLKELSVQQNRRFKIENLLLLIIRTLLLLLLIFYFAGSYFGQEIKHFSEKKSRIFVYLDSSPSMQSSGAGFTGQQSAAAAVRKLHAVFPQSEFKIVTAMPGEEYFINQSADLQVIERIREAPADRQIADIFKLADDYFYADERDISSSNNHIFIFTDGQIRSDSLVTSRSFQDPAINCFAVNDFTGLSEEPDFSLDSLRIRSDLSGLILNCYLNSDLVKVPETPLLELYGESSKLAERRVEFDSLGRSSIVFQLPVAEKDQKAYLKLGEDKNNSNNVLFFKLPGQKRQPLLVAGDTLSYSFKQISRMLRMGEFRNFFDVRTVSVNQLPQTDLSLYAAILLPVLPDLNSYSVSLLSDYLQSGGGLYLLSGSFDPAGYNSLLPDKLALPPITGINTVPDGFYRLTNINTRHPVLANVFNHGFKVSSVEIYKIYKSNSLESILAAGDLPLLVAGNKGKGRTLFLTTSLEKSWSNLGENGLLVPLLFNGLLYISTTGISQNISFNPFEEIILPSGCTSVTAPDGSEISVSSEGKLPDLQQTGFYSFADFKGTADFFAFNGIRETGKSENAQLFKSSQITRLKAADLSAPDLIFGADSNFSYWLLLLIFLLLAAELLISRRM